MSTDQGIFLLKLILMLRMNLVRVTYQGVNIYIHCSIGRDRQIVGWRVVVVVIVLCSLSRSIVLDRAGLFQTDRDHH